MKNPECVEFVSSHSFKQQFEIILQHDRTMFDEPIGWQTKSIAESPLVSNFAFIWSQLKEKYHTELSALAYRPIPVENDIAECFNKLLKRIQ
jgi:hypothetical protein